MKTMRRQVRPFWLSSLIMAALALLTACSGALSPTADPLLTSAVGPSGNVNASGQSVARISSNLPADFPVTVYQGAGFQDGDQVMFSELVAQGKSGACCPNGGLASKFIQGPNFWGTNLS